MMQFLRDAPEGGALSLGEFARRALTRVRRPGLVALITDFFDRAGHEAALAQIVARRHEAIVIHVLDREEWSPTMAGDLRLIDAEDEEATEISVTPALLESYRRRASAWSEEIEAYCTRRGMTYLRVLNDDAAEEVVLKTLRRLGRIE